MIWEDGEIERLVVRHTPQRPEIIMRTNYNWDFEYEKVVGNNDG